MCSSGLNFVNPQVGEMQGKWVVYSSKELVFIAAARVSGHGVVYCLKKFVAMTDVRKQWSPDTIKWGVNVFGIVSSVIYTSYMRSCLEISLGDKAKFRTTTKQGTTGVSLLDFRCLEDVLQWYMTQALLSCWHQEKSAYVVRGSRIGRYDNRWSVCVLSVLTADLLWFRRT